MQIIWENDAIEDLTQARDYIKQFNPLAATKIANKILNVSNLLIKNPTIGKSGRLHETRELLVADTPYTLVYTIEEQSIIILRVFHQSRKWSQFIKKD
jgi:addiction module RelE/StbE family toxin